MKELTIGANDAGQRLDRFLAKAVPLLPASLAQKYIRLKRIKCNGARAQRDTASMPEMFCSCISTTSFLISQGKTMPI